MLTLGALIFVDRHGNTKKAITRLFAALTPAGWFAPCAAAARQPGRAPYVTARKIAAVGTPVSRVLGLGLGGLGFAHALLQTLFAALTTTVQFFLTLNFLMCHGSLQGRAPLI